MRGSKLSVLRFLLPVLLSATAAPCQNPLAPSITEARIRAHLQFIAQDGLGGRDTPSLGQDLAASYIATQLQLWGLEPGGSKGTYYQDVPMITSKVIPDRSLLKIGATVWSFGDGFVSSSIGGNVVGPLVFVGHGIQIPSMEVDPYKGMNLSGKIAVVTTHPPKGFDYQMFNDGRALPPEVAAAAQGAVALIVMEDQPSQDAWKSRIERATKDGYTVVPGVNQDPIPVISVVGKVADELMSGERVGSTAILTAAKSGIQTQSFAMDKHANITLKVDSHIQLTRNIVAVIPGIDRKLKNEFVAASAHIDHIGSWRGPNGVVIFNGADDDGSGTSALLELAHAFMVAPRQKRSILLIWHTGEEVGQLGSRFFVANPTVPLKNIVSLINLDMIGRSRTLVDTNPANEHLSDRNHIYVVGSYRLSRDLGDTCANANKDLYGIKFDYRYDDPSDTEHIYERSDHFNYATHGIPVAFFYGGSHEDYHRPSDDSDKIDFDKLTRVAKTVFEIMKTLAGSSARPRLNGTDFTKQLTAEKATKV